MRKINLLILAFSGILLVSCQKEIDWATSSGGGGGTDGDLLVSALQVTVSTNDTNRLAFEWDGSKRLTQYKSFGKVSGVATDILHKITRLGDGKIARIVSKTSLSALIDSTVYTPFYNGAQLRYVIDTQYTVIGNILDSIVYTYTAGKVSAKETYSDFFGGMDISGKETYEYDASGNVTVIKTYSPDGLGGVDLAGTTTNTYDGHKAMVTLGEESYIVLGAANVSPRNSVKQVTNAVSSGTTYTSVISNFVFNSFDRPRAASIKVTPQPPGYDLKLSFFYQ